MDAITPPEDLLAAPRLTRAARLGPVTTRKLRRTVVVYGLLCCLGLLPGLLGASPGWQAAGLGLLVPGGGFAAYGGWHFLMFPAVLGLFGASLIAWFWAGMVVAPLGVWLGSALLAGAFAPAETWRPAYAIVPLTALALYLRHHRVMARRRAANLVSLQQREQYLPAALAEVARRCADEPAPGSRELTPDQLSAVRYLLDRGLQPVDGFKGFDTIDQFQPAAFRYQINHCGFGLGMVQTHYTPSFHGYLRTAQKNLILKYINRRVWGYWVYESMWGHLNFSNWDPAAKDNIMLTGWFGMQLGIYAMATGDRSFADAGSLPFRLNDKTVYQHDHHTMVQSVVNNFRRCDYTLYPCEPNWVYPICNHYGMAALASHDAVYNTRYTADILPKWLEVLDTEFTQENGTLVGLRSEWTGIEMPFYTGEAGFAFFANIFVPGRAQRMWAIARTELSTCLTQDAAGHTRLTLPKLAGIEAIDPGYYRPGMVFAYAAVLIGAREFGDTELADATLRSMDQDCAPVQENGVTRYRKGSYSANIWAAEGKIMGTGDFRNAFVKGPPASVFKGPILTDAIYPNVLVAKAFSDGADLQLVLYPGAASNREQIRLERLVPGAAYAVRGDWHGGDVKADGDGCLDLTVDLHGRTALHLVPV